MTDTKWFVAVLGVLLLTAPPGEAATHAGAVATSRNAQRAATAIDNVSRIDVNNIDMVVTNHGSIALDLETGGAGLVYPRGSTRTAVFAAGIWLGALVNGEIRTAVGEYSQEFTPGPMKDSTFLPDNPVYRNYRIERGGKGFADYMLNAVPQGAPTDSTGDAPLLLGDVAMWSVFNDADPSLHTNRASRTAPLGVEVQQTVFAFRRAGALGNIVFVKWKILNKGGNQLDDAYVSVWADPDLGGFTDDLVGCDTLRSLGFCYNATNNDGQYLTRPPAVGFDFFKGPVVPDGLGGFRELGMTSFNKYINGTDPNSFVQTYNYMQGLKPDGSPLHVNDDAGQPITTYQVAGDPVTGEGWLDSNPADRRLFLSSGPFDMAPGDSQEVVTAIIIGQSSNRLTSISDLRIKDDVAQKVFDLNFDIPPPPPSPSVHAQALDRGVRLVWGSEPVGDVQTNTDLNQEFHFEGFRVWQMASDDPDREPTVLATYDVSNGSTNLYVDELNPVVGAHERALQVAGTDHGLEFSLEIASDAIRGGRLVNNKEYYFAVTAYSYDINNVETYTAVGEPVGIVTEVLESPRDPLAIAPRSSSAIFEVGAEATKESDLNLGGEVAVEQLQQNEITGDLYRVTFEEAESETWTLFNVTEMETLLTNQPSIFGAYDSPIVDGFMVRVVAPRGVADFGEVVGSTFNSMVGGVTDQTGTWHIGRLSFDADGNAFPSSSSLSYTLFPGGATSHDFELRVLSDTTEVCWTYGSGEASFPASFKIPFEIWDLGWNSIDDPSDDRKMSLMVRQFPDSAVHGDWRWNDVLYVREIPYADLLTASPTTPSTQFVPDGSDQTLGRFVIVPDDSMFAANNGWPAPTTIRIIARRFTTDDVYEFQTAKVGSAPGSVVGNDLKKILAVPNPYYARSSYELTQFDRVMKFTNIPASRKVTLRIFNLGGDLVRSIVREATTADEQAVATLQWDLNTDRNLPVASGVYIYRIDVQGVGSKMDRIAVFIEQERLDNF